MWSQACQPKRPRHISTPMCHLLLLSLQEVLKGGSYNASIAWLPAADSVLQVADGAASKHTPHEPHSNHAMHGNGSSNTANTSGQHIQQQQQHEVGHKPSPDSNSNSSSAPSQLPVSSARAHSALSLPADLPPLFGPGSMRDLVGCWGCVCCLWK